jgi:predicted transcriptional regulator
MRKIQNTNISFRATNDLKQRLTDFCLENDLHNSNVIRQALNSYLRQETKEKMPALWRTANILSMQPQ